MHRVFLTSDSNKIYCIVNNINYTETKVINPSNRKSAVKMKS